MSGKMTTTCLLLRAIIALHACNMAVAQRGCGAWEARSQLPSLEKVKSELHSGAVGNTAMYKEYKYLGHGGDEPIGWNVPGFPVAAGYSNPCASELCGIACSAAVGTFSKLVTAIKLPCPGVYPNGTR
jgi:hypothetical protein